MRLVLARQRWVHLSKATQQMGTLIATVNAHELVMATSLHTLIHWIGSATQVRL